MDQYPYAKTQHCAMLQCGTQAAEYSMSTCCFTFSQLLAGWVIAAGHYWVASLCGGVISHHWVAWLCGGVISHHWVASLRGGVISHHWVASLCGGVISHHWVASLRGGVISHHWVASLRGGVISHHWVASLRGGVISHAVLLSGHPLLSSALVSCCDWLVGLLLISLCRRTSTTTLLIPAAP
jgi:hypothetical protein